MPLFTSAALGATFVLPGSLWIASLAIGACGLTYGLNAVALPVIVSRLYGQKLFAEVYGKVFTAWGVAGILAPWLAGRLYDATGGYAASLAVSLVVSLVAALAAATLPRAELSDPARAES